MQIIKYKKKERESAQLSITWCVPLWCTKQVQNNILWQYTYLFIFLLYVTLYYNSFKLALLMVGTAEYWSVSICLQGGWGERASQGEYIEEATVAELPAVQFSKNLIDWINKSLWTGGFDDLLKHKELCDST